MGGINQEGNVWVGEKWGGEWLSAGICIGKLGKRKGSRRRLKGDAMYWKAKKMTECEVKDITEEKKL